MVTGYPGVKPGPPPISSAVRPQPEGKGEREIREKEDKVVRSLMLLKSLDESELSEREKRSGRTLL